MVERKCAQLKCAQLRGLPRIRSGATCLPTTMGTTPSKPLSTPAVEEKHSSQSGLAQATVRLQALNLDGLGEAVSKDGTLSEGNVQEWEQKAGKVHQLLYMNDYY